MTTAATARSMWPMTAEQPPRPDKLAIGTDWDVLAIFRATPTTSEPIHGAVFCTVDADASTTGELRIRPASSSSGPSLPVPVSGPVANLKLGYVPLVAGADQLVFVEGRRTTGVGGIRLRDARGSVVNAPPPALVGATEFYPSTFALGNAELAPRGQLLAWMPCTAGATDRRSPNWELGQESAVSTNGDGSPSYGFWFPNDLGPPAYSNADYHFITNTTDAFSGPGYLRTILANPYTSSAACQVWRLRDQAGVDLPHTAYFSWRMRFHEVITYDNTDGSGHFGFTNHFQIYRTSPSNLPLITLGAGKNLASDSAMRWHINLDNRVDFDLTQITTPAIPLNAWIHMEVYSVISDGADGRTGRLAVWQDGVQILNHTGPTIADFWSVYGVSWGSYGTLMGQNPITIDYDECAITTVATHDRLVLPSPTGGLGS